MVNQKGITEQQQQATLPTVLLGLSILSGLAVGILLALHFPLSNFGFLIIAIPFFLALYVKKHRFLSVISFSLWVITFITAPMIYPTYFKEWGDFQLKVLVIPLIQFIMFGMGTTLSVGDFKRVLTMPQAVFIGILLQFTIMPLTGKFVAMTFTSNPEVAAGVILVGTSPCGVASNVINYLAGNNLALAVTLTATSTLLAPFLTPTLTKWLANTYVPVDFWEMMLSIFNMVLIPVGAGLIVNKLLRKMGEMHHKLLAVSNTIMKRLPGFSMLAICLSVSILTANAREQLLIGSIVFSIVFSVMVHNFLGLLLGYWSAKALRLKERDCRTIAVEVGMQNSGMAAGLALSVFKSSLAAAPGVVYSSWHNITGAILASWWSRRPPKNGDKVDSQNL